MSRDYNISRRTFVKQATLSSLALPVIGGFGLDGKREQTGVVELNWLEGSPPSYLHGITWGLPWAKGQVRSGADFVLENANGESSAVQSWPLAYWPDGSLKWTAHAVGRSSHNLDSVRLVPKANRATDSGTPIASSLNDDLIAIDTGIIQARIRKKGDILIEELNRNGKKLAINGTLLLQVQNAVGDIESSSITIDEYRGAIEEVKVEQNGPIKAVVKLEGKHINREGRAWLPFIVRLYFYKDSDAVRIMHTIVYDGNEQKDFIRGIGVRFDSPQDAPLHDRHVRFVGANGGVFAEAIRGLTGLRRDPGIAIREAQVKGLPTPPTSLFPGNVADGLKYIPSFGDYTLLQASPEGFAIKKRTSAGHGWLQSGFGRRASGLAYLGSPQGGIALGIRNFWQSFPGQLDIRHAASDNAQVTAWFWAPDAEPMDLRFYHDGMGQDTYAKQREALDITYEDYEPGFGRPIGVARTSEIQLLLLDKTPSNGELAILAKEVQNPPLLTAQPAYFEKIKVFGGAFSVAMDVTDKEQDISNKLDYYFNFYKNQVDERYWYGFWDYGDVMHSYDSDRHTWRYDVGGFAWDNSELSTDLWLWYYFLSTGRADVFRFAEAMCRHTGEVDVHHLGPFSPLGSRHNVQHWGCSAKQLRISTAANRRIFYYLTGDERVGDLLREQIDADRTLSAIVPGRKIGQKVPDLEPRDTYVSVAFGTDWGALAAAWLTEWERTGNERVKNKLLNSMKSIARQPQGFFTGGGIMALDTGKFLPAKDKQVSVSHLSASFGLAEICYELLETVDVPEFKKAWLQYCLLYNASEAEQVQALGVSLGKRNLRQGHARLTAFAAKYMQDGKLANRAWEEFDGGSGGIRPKTELNVIAPPTVLNPVTEDRDISTNAIAQWGLAAIQLLAFTKH